MKKKTYTVEGMHCTSCAMVIESDLEDGGVKAVCSYAKQRLDVEYDENTVTDVQIREIVKKSGYSLSE